MNSVPVFILSDFGCRDTYTAQMKAAILSFAGYGTPVIDLTSGVGRGNLLQGAFHLRASLPTLPEGSVTLAVVDPGVGGPRGGLAALWQGRYLVAPDNGLVSLLEPPVVFWKLPPPDPSVSSTFHGRDWFAPCAARLAVDPEWTSFLEPMDGPVLLPSTLPEFNGSRVSLTVLHTDSFGNCILGIDTSRGSGLSVRTVSTPVGDTAVRTVAYYDEAIGNELLFIGGSQGFMELAVKGGSAAELLGLEPGMRIGLKTEQR